MSAPEAAFARALYDAAENYTPAGDKDGDKDKVRTRTEEEREALRTALCEELTFAVEILGQYPTVFYNPSVSSRHILRLLSVFEGKFSALGYQFLCLLTLRRRLKYLPRITPRFAALCEKASGKVRVRLSLPYAPSEKLLGRLRESLAVLGLYSKRSVALAEFDVSVDKSLVGGFIAECDGLLLDRSLRTKLMHISKG
jgi:F0F1-type ATP synthase delta subunit